MCFKNSSATIPNQQRLENPVSANSRQVVGEQQWPGGITHLAVEADDNLMRIDHGHRAYWPASYS
ncbi:MAG: hypothetical protein QG655_2403 [Actinomycetota bacterium]|nr:hypothetical protein [Actinomycetota bacterium]